MPWRAVACVSLLLLFGACGEVQYELQVIPDGGSLDFGDPLCSGDGHAYLSKVAAADGSTAWRTRVPVPRQASLYYPSITPTGSVVVVATVFPVGLVALDAEDGRPLWQMQTNEFMARFHPVRNGLGIVAISGHDSSVRAVDPRFGTEIWAGEPLELDVHHQHQVFVSGDLGATSAPGGSSGFSVRTGVETWSSPTRTGIFGGTATAGVAALEVTGGSVTVLDLATGDELWSTDDIPNAGGGFVAGAGKWIVLTTGTGMEVRDARTGEIATRFESEDLAGAGPRRVRVQSTAGSMSTVRVQANDLVGAVTVPEGVPRILVTSEAATLVIEEATWTVDPFTGMSSRPRSRRVHDAAIGSGIAYLSVSATANASSGAGGRVQAWSLEDGSLLWELTTDRWVHELTPDGAWLYASESCSRLQSG